MNNPLVSVIIPTYKRKPEMLNRAVKSVVSQTYPNIELIIVDDSPNNYKYRNAVQKYASEIKSERVNYIQHENNMGANKARNTGIKIAKGEYCAFLDDDDEWLENKIELQLKEFTSPTIGLVYCKAISVNKNNNTITPMINSIKKGYFYYELLKQNFVGSNSYILIRTEILKEIGGYDENLISNQDYDLFLRIAKKYQIVGVNEILVKYHNHGEERITTNRKKQLKGRLELYEKYKEDINKYEELNKIWKIKNIPLYYRDGYRIKAVLQGIKLFLYSPTFVLNYLKKTAVYRKKTKQTIEFN